MTAAIAAYRAGNAPHILQVFEVGTATMMAAKGAVVPVYKLMKDADEPFNPKAYLRAGRGLLHRLEGQHAVVPLQQLHGDLLLEQGRLQEGGPRSRTSRRRPGRSWSRPPRSSRPRARRARTPPAWPSWVHVENFSAWHNVPIGTQGERHGGHRTPSSRSTRRCTCSQLTMLQRPGQEGPVQLRRAHQPGATPSSPAASARC